MGDESSFFLLKTLREIPGSAAAAKPSIYAGGRIAVYPDDNLDIREADEQCSFARESIIRRFHRLFDRFVGQLLRLLVF